MCSSPCLETYTLIKGDEGIESRMDVWNDRSHCARAVSCMLTEILFKRGYVVNILSLSLSLTAMMTSEGDHSIFSFDVHLETQQSTINLSRLLGSVVFRSVASVIEGIVENVSSVVLYIDLPDRFENYFSELKYDK